MFLPIQPHPFLRAERFRLVGFAIHLRQTRTRQALLAAALLFAFSPFAAGDELAQVQVLKQPANSAKASTPPFLPFDSTLLDGTSYSLIAEYPAFALCQGPSDDLTSFLELLAANKYQGAETHDLDTIEVVGHSIDADSGLATPPYADIAAPARADEQKGMYLVALAGYATDEWLASITAHSLTIIDAIPPGAYLVFGTQQDIDKLKSDGAFVRGAFLFSPAMKIERVLLDDSSALTSFQYHWRRTRRPSVTASFRF
jgi:hypothetical protein